MSIGRPTDYSPELIETVCSRLASGEPLVKICRDEDMPATTTVYRWLSTNETFRDMYARAREDQADTLADQIIDIADEDPRTVIETDDEDTTVRVDAAAVQHQRLRVEARKWIAAKLKPRKYADVIKQELTGAEGKPLEILVVAADAIRNSIRG